ncbi:hypothetical protein KFE25_007160 [Diacronema lutheri]|uniref:Uncharacterized protein n=1 Tax=Diacronema lutheri TaxID=2081491 RepID=A0A8J5XIF0_DIALT|nr:hypothetical protein KFE25_007160 [Diacronema lutheri]
MAAALCFQRSENAMGAAASARYRQRPASSKDGDASSKDAAAARCAEAERDEFVDADPSRVPGGPRARLRPSKLGDAPDDAHETDRVTAFSPSPDSSRSAQLHGAALITADKVNGWRPPLGVKPRGVGHLVFDSTIAGAKLLTKAAAAHADAAVDGFNTPHKLHGVTSLPARKHAVERVLILDTYDE